MIKKVKISKKALVIFCCAVLTLINAGGLGYVVATNRTVEEVFVTVPPEVVTPKIEITNAKKRDTDVTLQGKKIGEGSYKSETLSKSKITSGNAAKLIIASHEATGAHFVLAFLSSGNIPNSEQLEPGWGLQTISDDPMWSPGACASKPTFLLSNKYIFIDDGITNPEEKYNSYVLFDMQNGEYRYFGGNNFTDTQAKKEQVMMTVNENDKLVFYIDPVDDQPYLEDSGRPGHIRGKDHAYVIRREIDPVTLAYTDYSLPFNVPAELANYYVYAHSDGKEPVFSFYAPYTNGLTSVSYQGRLEANSIKVISTNQATGTNHNPNGQVQFDSDLELALDPTLRTALVALTNQKPYDNSQYKTLFNATELGSYHGLQFLNVSQRYGQLQGPSCADCYNANDFFFFSTPAIFDSNDKRLYPMVAKPVLRGFRDYVNLGVF